MFTLSYDHKYPKISLTHILFILFSLTGLTYSPKVKAQGDLFINPKRIVFEGQKRAEEISLANIGTDTTRYLISFVQIRLTESGEFEQIEKPDSGQYFADKHLRIFPRTVTLAPKETQIVKIQTYQKENLAPGEYRSHLYFRAVARENTATEKPAGEQAHQQDNKNLSIKIIPVFGITIPVIIKIGESNTTVSIAEVKLETIANTTPSIKMRLNRTGNMSAYGDISIDHISTSGKTTRVGFIKGISLYTPTRSRNIKIALNYAGDLKLTSGRLNITYTGTKDGKPEKFASAELAL